ncbi:histone-lysine N-methyltransferase SETMAR [Plakobranchus ocellatus]|uniref:Histone-lysine N-methyltransferase SETMAR n=1 Tax=Plakobranchus ocellatus TaxID=259542 RepID=A0AAV4C776_9GAST|nr:histone-lysine N-methyltransferase SETMAR [Plakobranchus ocellatus]
MTTAIKEWSKLEVRAVVRFLFSKGIKPSEIHKQIAETYGEGAMSRSRVYQWCSWLWEGRTSLGHEPKSGRSKTSTNEENTARVDELIRCDRRMKLREIALKLEIPKTNLTQQWLQRYGWEILHHPAYSPDLAPSDFHLFGPLKRHFGGMAFETKDDLISELRNWFDNLDVDFFRVGINSLLSR